MSYIIGIFILLLYALWALFVATLILISSAFVFIVPNKSWRRKGKQFLQRYPVWWMDGNYAILKLSSHEKVNFHGSDNLDPKGSYIVISNHRSWIDILVMGNALNRKIPTLKFFMKKSLLWMLPLIGPVCYILGFPLMARHSREQIRKNPALKGKDIETTRRICQQLQQEPTALINFAEGTRFTAKKHALQNSPYTHLLKPKAGGAAIVINEMQPHLNGIVNVTIDYEPVDLSFWDFARGKFDKITVLYELVPIEERLLGNYYEDRQFRAQFQQWLNDLWERKDALISKLKEEANESNASH